MRALRLYVAAFFLVMFLPIAIVALFSFNSARSLQRFEGFSLEWYRAFLDSESLRGSLVASIEIAVATMVVATLLGTLLAFGLVRARTRWAPGANVLMLIPLVTPEIVAGVSAFLLFTQVGLRLSLLTITLAHITFSISYVTVVVRARMSALNPEIEAAAMDLGATRLQTFRLVVLPELWPAILAAGTARLRALVRRLRALVLHDGRVAAAVAGADLVRDPVRRDADDQRDRNADDRDLGPGDRGGTAARAAVCAQGLRRRPVAKSQTPQTTVVVAIAAVTPSESATDTSLVPRKP